MRAARFWFSPRRQEVEPFVFFSYGMTKCGSTLAFELARTALLRAGCAQPQLDVPLMGQNTRINAVPKVTPETARIMREAVQALGHPIVVKTHSRPDPAVVRMIEAGEARAHAVFRDPREMALSMLDAGDMARAKGRRAFAEIATLADARAGIDNQMDSLTAWLQLPGVRRLQYDALAFDTAAATGAILDHLGLTGRADKIAAHVLRHEFTQRNKAVPRRHEREMSVRDSAVFLADYAPFYELVLDKPDPGMPLPPGTSLKSARPAPQYLERT